VGLVLITFLFLWGCVTNNTVIQPVLNQFEDSEAVVHKKVTPTIYYIPRYTHKDMLDCPVGERADIKTIEHVLITRACKKIIKFCEMQGSCEIPLAKKYYLITIDRRNEFEERTFQFVNRKPCYYGLGANKDSKKAFKNMCTDPFYSVAADLDYYKLGDVVHIPELKGVKLPNGEKHTGYFIVRDRGHLIRGPGRFDFFTGHYGLNKKNPFYVKGLTGDVLFPDYRLVTGAEADKVRFYRQFPLIRH
jgi:3D (Asp-Asp-Asp) domain-containing protein